MSSQRHYRPTESKYKGTADEYYVTYDLEQQTRGGNSAIYPKVHRVYIAGDVNEWNVGDFNKRSGRRVHGVKVDYEQSRAGYHRKGYTAHRGHTTYHVSPTDVEPATSHFAQVIEIPDDARNVRFREGPLPERYADALQSIR